MELKITKPINLFYEEPNADRWFKYDRYLRMIIRRIIRGKPKPGGVMIIAINLMRGLDKIGVPYRLNNYKYISKHPEEIACIIGKPHVLFNMEWKNPILFGAGIYSHPIDCPDLFERYPNVKRLLVPGEWMRKMFEPYYGNKVSSWPVGIDTEHWQPIKGDKIFDFLIYDKVFNKYETELVDPVIKILDQQNLSYQFINYGSYTHYELRDKLKVSKAVIFICTNETQGLAYQQILATGTPILAWDRGGYWQDPKYYPHKVKFEPVSSVPYWDERCGIKFVDADDFKKQLTVFLTLIGQFKPRDYIIENLSLEVCAKKYLQIYKEIEGSLI
ncbi:glycosyltransferase [Mucilaginibacter sp. UYCu711]|uniref:glycosyltransferase n=1 Tax=Mucilaginibacter sp. UYCu711 TaxID=3156339 RepID=UPI003D231011